MPWLISNAPTPLTAMLPQNRGTLTANIDAVNRTIPN